MKAMVQEYFFVVAAGNDTLDLGSHQYYPANYSGKQNMLTVGAVDGTNLAPFSNYNNIIVEIAAEGVNIVNAEADIAIGNNGMVTKSGTSMAAPFVSAAAAIAYCGQGPDPIKIRETILACADQVTSLNGSFINGSVLNPDGTCLVIMETGEASKEKMITLYPNPTSGPVQLEVALDLSSRFVVEAYSLSGELLFRRENDGLLSGQPLHLDFSRLPSGLYAIRIIQDGRSWVGRLVKE